MLPSTYLVALFGWLVFVYVAWLGLVDILFGFLCPLLYNSYNSYEVFFSVI